MELRQLRHFLAVADQRHFTRAARQVQITESSLSSSIRSLERGLGGELFARSTRRVELTEAGRALLPVARRAIAAAEHGQDAVAAVRSPLRGELTIGVIEELGLLDLPVVLARYHRRHPAVALRLSHGSVSALIDATANGRLQLAFVDCPLGAQADRVRARTLGTDALILAVAADDPLARRRRVPLADLADRDFVEYRADSALRTRVDKACQESGLRRRSSCEVDTIPDLVALVAHGLGIALLPPLALRDAGALVAAVRTDPTISRELVVVTANDRAPIPAAAALLELLSSHGLPQGIGQPTSA